MSAGGLDAPLGMIRNGTAIVLHRNWKGLVTFATDDAGDPTTCAPDQASGCDLVSFPGVTWGATLLHPDAMDTETWYGTVPMGFMDKTGLIYRRNRYYDPSSEQFTQPDPIGMAGGLGIYAYVGGDPVNGGDPYGLEQEGCELSGEVTDDGIPVYVCPEITVPPRRGLGTIRLASIGIRDRLEAGVAADLVREVTQEEDLGAGKVPARGRRFPCKSTPRGLLRSACGVLQRRPST